MLMSRFGRTILFAMLLFVNGAFAFVQSPITPSNQKNYYLDMDKDGRLDMIVVRFLGTISQKYIDEMLDSLSFVWVDTLKSIHRFVVPKNELTLDSLSNRQLKIDLSKRQEEFLPYTSLLIPPFSSKTSFGACVLYMANEETPFVDVPMKDAMAPSMKKLVLRSYSRGSSDTLTIDFTEQVKAQEGCETYLEFKSENDSKIRILPSTLVEWNYDYSTARFIFDENIKQSVGLTPKDSIRLLTSCIADTLGNSVSKDAKFFAILGSYPFELYFQNIVQDYERDRVDSIFQVFFDDVERNVPNDSSWGVAMNVLGSEFEKNVREILDLKPRKEFKKSRVTVFYNVWIYNNVGDYIAHKKVLIKGDDPRFEGEAKKVYLRWNLLNEKHRRVSTGAYIARVSVVIRYDNRIVWKNSGKTEYMFGILRR